MQGTAVSWLVWKLTHSTFWLGAVGFAAQIPILVFGLLAGVIADRARRHTMVIVIQSIAMLQATILAVLTLTGTVNIYWILLLSLFMGFIMAFDFPTRQSFLMDMVGREDISNAVALNSSIVHGSRVLGPVAAGFIIAIFGEGTCFVINAISFLCVLASLLLMNKEELYPQVIESGHSVKESIAEGMQLARRTREIWVPLAIMAVLSFAAMPYIVLLPQIVSVRFGGSARELGIAMSAAGLGALIGAAGLALRKENEGLIRVIKVALGISGVGLVALAFIPTLITALPVLMVIGLSGYLVVAGTNTILQLYSPPESRGRIMSIFTVTFFGLTPVGSILAGHVASIVGVGPTIASGGVICLIVYSVFVAKKWRRGSVELK